MQIQGKLIAQGTNGNEITFTSNESTPSASDYVFKFFEPSVDASFDGDGNYSSGSILEYCIIEYGQGVYLNYAFPFINNCTIRYNGTYPGIYGSAPSGVSGKITNNQFYNNSEGGLRFGGNGGVALIVTTTSIITHAVVVYKIMVQVLISVRPQYSQIIQ
jgi:hypothetical protein